MHNRLNARRIGAQPRRALIVDNSAGSRLYLSTVLSTLGFVVIEADDGAQAFDEVLSDDFDLVLTHLQLPVISGAQLVSAISLFPESRPKPFIFVVSSLEPGDPELRRPEISKVDAILTTPVDASELAKLIVHLFEDGAEDTQG